MRPRLTRAGRTSAVELAGAAGLAWALHLALPLAAEDPFRPSLVILPAVVAALRALGRHAPRRQPPRGVDGLGEAATLLVLVLLAVSRHSLGLAAADWFVAGGLVLLLAHRVVRLLPCWLPALARERVSAAFFLLPLVVYLALLPWQGAERPPDGDEPFYLLLTHSLTHDFDADLADNYAGGDWRAFMERPIEPQPGDPRGPRGEVYSRHNLLLPLVLAPAYLAGGRWGAMAMMAVLTAALAWQVLALARLEVARRRGSAGAALLAYAVFAFGPPLLLFSYQVWIEVPAALVVAVLLARVRDLPREPRARELLVLLALLALLPLLKLRLGLVALPLAALAVYRLGPAARVKVAGGLAAVFAAVLVHNQVRYGNLLKIHSWSELDVTAGSTGDVARGGLGVFYDSAFGLFPSAPIWALLIPAGWLLLRRRVRWLGELGIVSVPYLALVVPRVEWYGGWSPPFRYPLVFLPLLALVLVPLFEHRRRPGLRALIAALGALTVVLTAIWVVEPGWTYNFADGRTRLLDQAGARLGGDVARLFPSMVRPRTATWVWPLLSLLLIPLAAWRGRARWRRAAGVWGFAAVLAAAAVVPLLARHAPTRVVELEDAWVAKERGRAFPDDWVRQRTRFASGWVIPPRGRAEAPIAAGGATARLRLVARAVKPGVRSRLVVAAGAAPLARVDVRAGPWQEIELGPFPWPEGEALVLRGAGPSFPGRVAVDRVEWTWE